MVTLADPAKKEEKRKRADQVDSDEWGSVRLAAASRRRWKWGLLAGALITAGAGVGVVASTWGDTTRAVAVLTADLPAGHTVTADDIRTVDLHEPDGFRLVSPDMAEGMVLTRPVPEGSPLVAASVADTALWPEQGQAVVSVPVTNIPSGMEEGTHVDLTPKAASEDQGAQDADTVTGIVHRADHPGQEDELGVDQSVVEVVLPREQAVWLSGSMTGDEVGLAVVNPWDGSEPEEEEGEEPE
ncbi:SAF domain-containing protein [Nocardiopsis salina]|uniref:SAF domain-containing protein n=1 Tax=Nocardiopsis salina TaxID=245836 RepID=UPI000A068F67|nr:SAF domain-containing protein [Nocardiopsis salina]